MGRAYRYPPDVAFYIYFSTNVGTEYFKHAAHSPFFSSECRLFHNDTFFGSCIIHILHTECVKFKVCKSVHHRTIQINDQPDAIVFQFIILTFIYSSTCFGRFPAHNQELNDQWQPLVLPSYRGDSRAVFVIRPAGPTTNTARLSPRYEGKTRGCHCSHWAPDDGRENARNMLSCEQTSG
jgi:hypothetical protein